MFNLLKDLHKLETSFNLKPPKVSGLKIAWLTNLGGSSHYWILSWSMLSHVLSKKKNHQTALKESLMMATLPLFSATLTTSHPCRTYIGPLSEFILYSDTTNKSSLLLLPLPTSTTCYLPQHNQSPTTLYTCSMLKANHITHTPVLEVMGFGRHKDLQGFESALFGILQSMSLFVIWSILLPYSPKYLLICLCLYLYKYSSCSMYFASSNINLATLFS